MIRVRILPSDHIYSRNFHSRFSTLSKVIRRNSEFYIQLAVVRTKILDFGIVPMIEVLMGDDTLSSHSKEYLETLKDELPLVGKELQARVITYLLSIQDGDV